MVSKRKPIQWHSFHSDFTKAFIRTLTVPKRGTFGTPQKNTYFPSSQSPASLKFNSKIHLTFIKFEFLFQFYFHFSCRCVQNHDHYTLLNLVNAVKYHISVESLLEIIQRKNNIDFLISVLWHIIHHQLLMVRITLRSMQRKKWIRASTQ